MFWELVSDQWWLHHSDQNVGKEAEATCPTSHPGPLPTRSLTRYNLRIQNTCNMKREVG